MTKARKARAELKALESASSVETRALKAKERKKQRIERQISKLKKEMAELECHGRGTVKRTILNGLEKDGE